MPTAERVRDFITLVEQRRFVEAIEQFYTDDATMRDNHDVPRAGRDTLVAGEQKMLAAVREIGAQPVQTFLVDGDRAVINWVFDIVRHDGTAVRMDELALQRWRGDRICEERFFYDSASLQPRPAGA